MMNTKPDAVLIDDDFLVHATWNFSAKHSGKVLRAFKKPEDFFQAAPSIDRAVPIYVDSNLGSGVKGEEVARQIHALGFLEIYLATGNEPDSYPAMPWIKKIIGKDPPWAPTEP